MLTPQFTYIIPQQTNEIVIQAIADILECELNNQASLDSANFEAPKSIDVEKMIPYETENDLPAINVTLFQGTFESKTAENVQTSFLFYVDAWVNSPSILPDPADPNQLIVNGDELAAKKGVKLAGIIRAILDSYVYNKLDGALSQPVSIKYVKCQGIYRIDKGNVSDCLSDMGYRVVFMVDTNEPQLQIELDPQTSLLEIATAQVKIGGNGEGYYIDDNVDVFGVQDEQDNNVFDEQNNQVLKD